MTSVKAGKYLSLTVFVPVLRLATAAHHGKRAVLERWE